MLASPGFRIFLGDSKKGMLQYGLSSYFRQLKDKLFIYKQ